MSRVMSARKHKRVVAGHRSFEKGILFETEVADHFSKEGYVIKSRKRMKLGEVDILATKSSFWRGSHTLLIERRHRRHGMGGNIRIGHTFA
jgi:Holliday junction resolvase-like predicted endonuclease